MLKHEAILLDPSPGEIADALSEATAATNQGCRERRLEDSAARWRKFAREATSSAEGWRMWHGGRGQDRPMSHLLAGWWTDAVGRKHVVLRGRRLTEYEHLGWTAEAALATRPPLWHCYPDRLVRRMDTPETVWLAVCGCGAVGTPGSIAWTGDRCGPCYDQCEEYGPAAVPVAPLTFLPGVSGTVHRLSIRPDGLAVAAVGAAEAVVWSLTNPSEPRVFPFDREEYPHAITFLGGRFLGVVRGADAVAIDLTATAPVRLQELDAIQGYRHLFGGNNGLDVFESMYRVGYLELDANCTGWRADFTHNGERVPHASADGRYVLEVTRDVVNAFDAYTGTAPGVTLSPVFRDRVPVLAARSPAYDPHRGQLYVGGGNLLERYTLHPGFVERRREFAGTTVQLVALSGDGRTLVAVVAPGGVLHILDPETLATRAAYQWHLGSPNAVALSPDGRFAATAGVEGVVKLWPLDRLLPADPA